ncbi:DUF2922 domain-containing protein [Bacillus andreraoultii]|uniref:DUF2922 domain-containing protein n=1 Tax=Bacillus andreraoultii TaxID=1499685 RepID=UPI00053A2582|nr:DUF2922 domain-containing protein [Bacillus andreraoultii]
MDKNLELIFLTTDGKTVRITVNDPRSDLNEETIKNVMETIIGLDVFQSTNGASLASIKEAKIVEQSVQVFDLD